MIIGKLDGPMTVPQPFQYQGSKRALAPLILQYLPISTTRLVEPFCGSAALSIATAARGRAKEFWLNDFNAPLAKLLSLIVNSPKELGKFYRELWRADHADALEHYYQVRESFNRTQDAQLLLYLLARCVKGAVRYNGEGLFNQSPDKRRLGTQPETMQANLNAISALLRGKTIVTTEDVMGRMATKFLPAINPGESNTVETYTYTAGGQRSGLITTVGSAVFDVPPQWIGRRVTRAGASCLPEPP